MGAVWFRARVELRSRWRAWAMLGLVVGVLAGAALTSAAGARRAESAYPRFAKKYKAYDVILGGIATDSPDVAERLRAKIVAFPEVADYTASQFLAGSAILPSRGRVYFPEILVGGDPDGRELVTINRAKVLKGRLFNRDAGDEAVVDFSTADRFNLHVGDRIGIQLGDDAPRVVDVRVVGIILTPVSIPAVGSSNLSGVEVSPAFVHEHQREIPPNTDAPAVRLKRGLLDASSFIARVEKLHAGIDVPVTQRTQIRGVAKTLRYEVQALWILCALISLAGIAIFGQAISRQISAEGADDHVLLSIGMTPRQLVRAGLLRAAVIAIVAGVIAALTAIAASALTPIGLSRLIEPNPGIRIDSLIVFGGAGLVFFIVLATSAVPTARAARSASRVLEERPSRPSRAATFAAATGAAPSTVTGLRLAFESGHGARSVPLRSALLGLALAVSSFAAAGTFTASLNHLITTPSLYGYGWDFITLGDSTAQTLDAIQPDPDLEAIAEGGATNIRIGNTHLIPFTYEPGHGISPTMLEGRAPAASDEIALGDSLLKSLHAHIGSTVSVFYDDQKVRHPRAASMRVVGRTVVPTFFFQAVEPGQSSAITMAGYRRLQAAASVPAEQNQAPLIVRYKPGTDVEAKLAALQKEIPFLFTMQVRRAATELSAVSRSSGVPLTLTEVLLFMAVATLVHVLVTSVRKRRRDLAILKTIGFVRRQVRGAVAWQATALTVMALAIGLPIGVGIGRWVWTVFAGSIGVVPAPSVRVIVIVLAVPSAILAANLIAAMPARAAALTRPALVLREE